MRAPAEVVITAEDRRFAERLMAARIGAELRPRQLDRAAHLKYDTVAAIENTVRPATDAERAALAGALGMSTAELVGLVTA